MVKIEQLLGIAADSSKFLGWNDSLSCLLKQSNKELNDEQLANVAGGQSNEDYEKFKQAVFSKIDNN